LLSVDYFAYVKYNVRYTCTSTDYGDAIDIECNGFLFEGVIMARVRYPWSKLCDNCPYAAGCEHKTCRRRVEMSKEVKPSRICTVSEYDSCPLAANCKGKCLKKISDESHSKGSWHNG
jgi:hypothetical protein